MPTDLFEIHIQQSLQKLEDLGRRSQAISATDNITWQSSEELPRQQQQIIEESLAELSASIEELQLATETLRQQNEELLAQRYQLEAERQYYYNLFDSAPDSYFLTTPDGIVTEANQKTTELLGLSAKYLQKKAFAVFIDRAQRQGYYTKLNQFKNREITEAIWQLNLTPRQKVPFTVNCMVTTINNSLGEIIGLRWRISSISTTEVKVEPLPDNSEIDLTKILLDRLRYPLYNLVTQIEELQFSNKLDRQQLNNVQAIGNGLAELKQVVDDVYILDSLDRTEDLNPSLVDYTIFVRHLIQQFQQRHTQQQINFNSQNTYVGICDVFLLATIVRNLLDNAQESIALNSQITLNLELDSSQYLAIEVKYQLNLSLPEQSASRNLNLAVLQKSVELLSGIIERENRNDGYNTIIVRLPLR